MNKTTHKDYRINIQMLDDENAVSILLKCHDQGLTSFCYDSLGFCYGPM